MFRSLVDRLDSAYVINKSVVLPVCNNHKNKSKWTRNIWRSTQYCEMKYLDPFTVYVCYEIAIHLIGFEGMMKGWWHFTLISPDVQLQHAYWKLERTCEID